MLRRNFLKSAVSAFAVGAGPLAYAEREESAVGHVTVRTSARVLLQNPAVVCGATTGTLHTAATVLQEEVQSRGGGTMARSTQLPSRGPAIIITTAQELEHWPGPQRPPAVSVRSKWPAESFHVLAATVAGGSPRVWIVGADPRGALFGVGALLRQLRFERGSLSVPDGLSLYSTPAYAIRGHQLGYRAQANSYDGWTPTQFDQYVRELAFFGANSIESIPFQDERPTPVMQFSREVMNAKLGEICAKYGMDYWAWIPADFDLKDVSKRTALLHRCEQFFKSTPVFTAVSFPGGDPGDNPPELVFPFLDEMAQRLRAVHPQATIWPSLQQYTQERVDWSFDYIHAHMPEWMGGLVTGPSSPQTHEMRTRLPARYKLRNYPDLTHNTRCQYEVRNWDQAFAMAEGRECVNPRPVEFARYFQQEAGYSDGFISYSDGVHDDLNKTLWSALSWDPSQTVPQIIEEYAAVYFTPAIADAAADGILALERNWNGPLLTNGNVEDTLQHWQDLERAHSTLAGNWRWQMCQLRAHYDVFLRRKLTQETALEKEANARMLLAPQIGSSEACKQARAVLLQSETAPAAPDLRARIVQLCAALFQSIALQTSVKAPYYAINTQRGAVLDFLDLPLNNRWWLEDEFSKLLTLATEQERVDRLRVLATWEAPGSGSFYDNMGNIEKSDHVVRCMAPGPGTPGTLREPGTTFWWWDNGMSRARLSWQVSSWPVAVEYEAIDPSARYAVRSSGYGQALLRVNGQRIPPTQDGKDMGQIKEFPIPAELLRSRRLVLTWDPPEDEEHLNWRNKSRLSEVWLIRQ